MNGKQVYYERYFADTTQNRYIKNQEGIGKPEPLKYRYSGALSRRIIDEHRLIYTVEEDEIYFLSFRDHYK